MNINADVINRRPSLLRMAGGLFLLQIVVAAIVWGDFILGRKIFAFYDIGSDTYFQFVPFLIQQARALAAGWPGGWTFEVGMGGSMGLPLNPFHWLNIAFGPGSVEYLRFWAYFAKLISGGAFFYAFLTTTGRPPFVAAVVALAYSFCGAMIVDGQWDPHATDYALYPLVLWGIALFLRRGLIWPLPLTIAAAIACGVFPFSLGVFIVYGFVGVLLCSRAPLATLKQWVGGVFPLALLGLALAAPVVGPTVWQLLDSPRVTGVQALTSGLTQRLWSFNEPLVLFAQLAGLFHKDLLGIGSNYHGWMNYLEGPGFYVGVLPLVLIPQLLFGTKDDRRLLAVATGALVLFFIFPVFRYATFGFALPYFRVNNLWVALLLLVLAARALELVLERGCRRDAVLLTAFGLGGLLYALWHIAPWLVFQPHAWKIAALLILSSAGLIALPAPSTVLRWHKVLLLGITVLTAAWVSYPSFNVGRKVVTPNVIGYRDATVMALQHIRRQDNTPFYRIEKTFDSVSYGDALAQGYFGVKSYWFQGASMVRLYVELGLIPRSNGGLNYTNWLPNFGDRFPLYTLAGVKYMIAGQVLPWPGFRLIGSGYGVQVYRNDFALPLGVVYAHQVLADTVRAVPEERRDLLMLHAAIVDSPQGVQPKWFNPGELERTPDNFVRDRYLAPAAQLRTTGMVIEHFADERITGTIGTPHAGVLAFSIPFNTGWSLKLDGMETPLVPVNYGFMGAPITAGSHRIELHYRIPGLRPGIAVAAVAWGLLILLTVVSRRRQSGG